MKNTDHVPVWSCLHSALYWLGDVNSEVFHRHVTLSPPVRRDDIGVIRLLHGHVEDFGQLVLPDVNQVQDREQIGQLFWRDQF